MSPEWGSIDWVLTTTRTVRRRLDLDRPVPDDLILECLDLALQAPTGGDYQGWRWVVVRDPDLKAAIADSHRRALATVAPAGSGNAVLRAAQDLAAHLERVPALVIACIKGRLKPTDPPARAASLYGSIYPAIWSFQLALRSRGLVSTFTTVYLHDEDEVARLLGIPEGVTQAALLPVAYPVGDDFRPARRRPAAEVTFWDGWKNRVLKRREVTGIDACPDYTLSLPCEPSG